jgi:YhhN-like protein
VGTRRIAIAFLVAYVGLSVADVLAELADQALTAGLLPLFLMPLLVGFLWSSGPRPVIVRWVLVGLGFAWLGDWLGDPLLLKIIFFFGTQLAYCLAFRPYWRSSLLARPTARVVYAAGLGALVVAVSLRASGLLAAVLVYGASLALTVALATGVSRLAAAGALTFLVSDLVLAYGAFVAPPPSPIVSAVVMATYLPAQLMIVLATRRAAAAPGATEGTDIPRR